MRDYIKRLEDAAKSSEGEDIPNSTVSHAEAGIRVLFENSSDTVRILTTEFYAPFWENLKLEVILFLNKGGKLEILTIDKISEASQKLIEFFKLFSDKVKCNKVARETSRQLPNLIIADDKITRFERDDDRMQDGLVSAIINFNNKERAQTFNDFFREFSPKKNLTDKN